jgi:hypothetical protein
MIEWEQRATGNWHARADDGPWLGFVANVVSGGGEHRYWMASYGDRRLGEYESAEAAKAAVEALFIADLDSG